MTEWGVQLARICPPVGETPRLLCSSSSPSPKYQRTKLLLLPGWLRSFMPPFPLSMPQQVVCHILENASPLPCAPSLPPPLQVVCRILENASPLPCAPSLPPSTGGVPHPGECITTAVRPLPSLLFRWCAASWRMHHHCRAPSQPTTSSSKQTARLSRYREGDGDT